MLGDITMCREPIGAYEAIDWWACMQTGWQTDTLSIYLRTATKLRGWLIISSISFMLGVQVQYCAAPLPAIFLQNGKTDVLYTNKQVSNQDYGSQS